MKRPIPYFAISKMNVSNFGLKGKCSHCDIVPDSTALISGERYCKFCARRKFPENRIATFEPSDAKFKCAQCNDDQLSYNQYIIGSCCQKLAERKSGPYEFGMLLKVSRIHLIARAEEDSAERAVENDEEEMKKAEKCLEEAKRKVENSRKILAAKKEFRKKVQKRQLFVTVSAMKEDNEELEDTVVIKQAKMDCKLTCKVCFEIYNNARPQVLLASCGHHFCEPCVTALQQKNCPTCRTRFTPSKIIKVFD